MKLWRKTKRFVHQKIKIITISISGQSEQYNPVLLWMEWSFKIYPVIIYFNSFCRTISFVLLPYFYTITSRLWDFFAAMPSIQIEGSPPIWKICRGFSREKNNWPPQFLWDINRYWGEANLQLIEGRDTNTYHFIFGCTNHFKRCESLPEIINSVITLISIRFWPRWLNFYLCHIYLKTILKLNLMQFPSKCRSRELPIWTNLVECTKSTTEKMAGQEIR